ncbi:MAG TPA: hypothetical protein VIE67_07030, partial [Rudaea sp.]|uniref:hypothetical protein n=1 Tax=Rudaea sp. TaxID=2136325 RepID=UPI002F94401F
LSTFTTNPRNKTWETVKNALGETVESDDPGTSGGGDATTSLVVTQTFDAAGDVLMIARNGGNGAVTSSFTYDALGRKTSQNDSDSGTSSFSYNAAGDVIGQTDAKNQTISLSYDALGRKWQRATSNSVDGTNMLDTWTYDTAANGYGQLASESHSASSGTYTAFGRTMIYDSLGRLYQRTSSIAGYVYTETTAYDAYGRALQQQDATTQITTAHYTTHGFVDKQLDTRVAGGTLYELLATNERGQATSERRGGSTNLVTTLSYYANTGRLSTLCTNGNSGTCGLQDLSYGYDLAGNLTTRVHSTSGAKTPAEMLTYDALNRLTVSQLGTLSGSSLINIFATQTMTYDALGNLCNQATTGSVTNISQAYSYAGPAGCANHGTSGSAAAVTAISGTTSATYQYDADGNQTTRSDGRTLSYNVLNQIAKAVLSANVTTFEYRGEYRGRSRISAGRPIRRYVTSR